MSALQESIDKIMFPVGYLLELPGLERAGRMVDTGDWLLCDGYEYWASEHPELFEVMGTTYGGTGGRFKLPDLRGSRTFFGDLRTYYVIKRLP